MSVCSIVKLFPLGTVDDLIHYYNRPSASCNSASGRPQHPVILLLTILQAGMKLYNTAIDNVQNFQNPELVSLQNMTNIKFR